MSTVAHREQLRRIDFAQLAPGTSVAPRMATQGGYFMRCCECGLTHRLNFRIRRTKSGRAWMTFTVYRDERKTAAERRERNKTARPFPCLKRGMRATHS